MDAFSGLHFCVCAVSPCFLVLTNLSNPVEQAARYAAVLGAPLHVRLALLHLFQNPVLDPELMTVTAPQSHRSPTQTTEALRIVARSPTRARPGAFAGLTIN